MGARVNKDAYRQGLRDSLLGVPARMNPYGGNSVAEGVARRSWKRGMEHGGEVMNAAREFAYKSQHALGAQQQSTIDSEFIEKIGACLEIAI